jgi:hypothetical protein
VFTERRRRLGRLRSSLTWLWCVGDTLRACQIMQVVKHRTKVATRLTRQRGRQTLAET